MTQHPKQGAEPNRKRGRLIILIVLGVAVLLAVWGIVERSMHYGTLREEADDNARARVSLINPQAGPAERHLDLPANLAAWYQAPIYAQVSGYVLVEDVVQGLRRAREIGRPAGRDQHAEP
ncbi:type VI protein secretion system component VasK [Asaia bogorensis NBRC 16594]|nr:type VI protein secretion system component VasK [Asaia bogorensis NBRC 16594]